MGSKEIKQSGFKYDNNIQNDLEEYINKRVENNYYTNFNSNNNFIEINNANDTYIRFLKNLLIIGNILLIIV